jgi:hypothetical protein
MIGKCLTTALVIGMAALGCATSAFAEGWDDGLTVEIPFAFTVGHTTLSPGSYTIRRSSGVGGEVFEVSSLRGSETALFTARQSVMARPSANRDEIVFVKVADRYFLSEIDANPDGSKLVLARSKTERRLLAEGAVIAIDSAGAPVSGD